MNRRKGNVDTFHSSVGSDLVNISTLYENARNRETTFARSFSYNSISVRSTGPISSYIKDYS
jgi:hypothetical protein